MKKRKTFSLDWNSDISYYNIFSCHSAYCYCKFNKKRLAGRRLF